MTRNKNCITFYKKSFQINFRRSETFKKKPIIEKRNIYKKIDVDY